MEKEVKTTSKLEVNKTETAAKNKTTKVAKTPATANKKPAAKPKQTTKTATQTKKTTTNTKTNLAKEKTQPKPKVLETTANELFESKTTVDKNLNTEPRLIEEEPQKEHVATPTVEKKKHYTKLDKDVLETKKFAWLAYILFFIPLLINKNSVFVRHHANEGLEINIFDFLGATLLILGASINTTVNWIALLLIISTVTGIGLLVLTIITKIYMIITTLQGKSTVTPWMWNVRIIK